MNKTFSIEKINEVIVMKVIFNEYVFEYVLVAGFTVLASLVVTFAVSLF
ncbi:MAG: hypothetical protein ABRQ38_13570 [Candidatus Eremiobacterota bacterium]